MNQKTNDGPLMMKCFYTHLYTSDSINNNLDGIINRKNDGTIMMNGFHMHQCTSFYHNQ